MVKLVHSFSTTTEMLETTDSVPVSTKVRLLDIALQGTLTMAGNDNATASPAAVATPEAVAQGVLDFGALPSEGEEVIVEIPLVEPGSDKAVGMLTLAVRG